MAGDDEKKVGQGDPTEESKQVVPDAAPVVSTAAEEQGEKMANANYTERPFEAFYSAIEDAAVVEARKQISPADLRKKIIEINKSLGDDKKTPAEVERMAILNIINARSGIKDAIIIPDGSQTAGAQASPDSGIAKPVTSDTPETPKDPAAEKARLEAEARVKVETPVDPNAEKTKAETAIKAAAEKLKALSPKWNELMTKHAGAWQKYRGEHYDAELQRAIIARQTQEGKTLTEEQRAEEKNKVEVKIQSDFLKSIQDQLSEDEKNILAEHATALESIEQNSLKTDKTVEELIEETSAKSGEIAAAKGFLNKMDEIYPRDPNKPHQATRLSQFTRLIDGFFSNDKTKNDEAGKALAEIGGRGSAIFWIIFFLTPGGAILAPALWAAYCGIKKYNEGKDEKDGGVADRPAANPEKGDKSEKFVPSAPVSPTTNPDAQSDGYQQPKGQNGPAPVEPGASGALDTKDPIAAPMTPPGGEAGNPTPEELQKLAREGFLAEMDRIEEMPTGTTELSEARYTAASDFLQSIRELTDPVAIAAIGKIIEEMKKDEGRIKFINALGDAKKNTAPQEPAVV